MSSSDGAQLEALRREVWYSAGRFHCLFRCSLLVCWGALLLDAAFPHSGTARPPNWFHLVTCASLMVSNVVWELRRWSKVRRFLDRTGGRGPLREGIVDAGSARSETKAQ